jgi:uncharacterized protein with PQ loop repeat
MQKQKIFTLFLFLAVATYFLGGLYLSYFPQQEVTYLSPGEDGITKFNLPTGLLTISALSLGGFIFYGIIKERKKKKKNFSKLFKNSLYIIGIATAILTIPTLVNIWFFKDATGIHPAPWGAYLIGGFIWLGYAIVKKHKPLIITYAIWIPLEIFILLGIFLYG